MAETQAHALPPGLRIDEYEIVRVLGAGGFGVTYLAFDHNLDGPLAIKEYFPADIAVRADGSRVAAAAGRSDVFAWGLDRFLREARAIHRLRHPSIARVHRYVERHGTACIVMEALGETGSQPLDATEIEKLREAASQDDPQALAQLRTEASARNPEAQFALGEVYEHMDGDAVNWYDEAVEWYRKAADQGHADAQFRRGDLYQYRALGSADDVAAMAWYYRAALQGHVGAQLQLGNFYREGVPPHEETAVEWYRKAAVEGDVVGLWRLVAMFASGCGDRIPRDNDEAVGWLRKAADRGHVDARFTLGQMFSHGQVVPRDLVIAHMWFTLAENVAQATHCHPYNGPYERAQAANLEIDPDMTSAEMDEADQRAQAYPGASPEE